MAHELKNEAGQHRCVTCDGHGPAGLGGGRGGAGVTTDTPDPTVTGPASSRFTTRRAVKATRIVDSVVFRSSGQNLTTTGENIEMASRFFEPVLLGVAAPAIRSRVKR
ncbi:hypothetical protein ABZY02_18925 [Streptomyces sp. NPDC006649]|uniref:hypothetical protein n=1 Tax=Streptomyces sp. NPDC006649 TaxID=3156896 RepID=UPI0033BF2EA4